MTPSTPAPPPGASASEIEQALNALRAVFKAIHTRAAEEWLDLDLSMGQIKALFWLSRQSGCTVGHLADALHVGKPAASILVDRLVQLGYVTRTEDAADRRRTLTRLSPEGETLVTRLRAGGQERLRAEISGWLSELDPGDVHALARGLDALARVATSGAPPVPDPTQATSTSETDESRM